jgi:hypothetical protein
MKYIKIISSIILIGLCTFSITSCKYLKQKFAKNKEVVQDSFLMSLNEGALDTSLIVANENKVVDNVEPATNTTITETPASNTITASTNTNSNTVTEVVKPIAAKPVTNIAQPAAKPITTNKIISSVPANNSVAAATANNTASKKSNANTQTASNTVSNTTGRRYSTSIYDGINDEEERMIVRKAEGYVDVTYIDDYNGSNADYEKRYMSASDLGKNYSTPNKKAPAAAWPKAPANNKPASAKATADEVDAARMAEQPKKATPTSRMGDKPKEEKPTSAEEMTKKKN